jgi:two-component system, NtrC family, response regulator
MNPKLLIVEDEDAFSTQMKWTLGGEYELLFAADRAKALEIFRGERPPVVLLDLGLPPSPGSPQEGLELLSELLALNSQLKVIVLSGQGEQENALQAIGGGAYDFISKPPDPQELKIVLKRTFYVTGLEKNYRDLERLVRAEEFEGMLGRSPQIQRVFSTVRKVAGSDAPVLVLGESGTGKEMVATAIHSRSGRKDAPFIAINCSAIPGNLLESELFGHEKGAFTGAHAQRKGRFEMAAGGTLFLDEIGELPTVLQAKLLRFLQEQRIQRVGGRQDIEVDTRVIAATHVDLKRAITEGRFREDLYYRLAVVIIHLPPLRERNQDIRHLAESFLHRFAEGQNKKGLAFNREALRALHAYTWPGNIRELENRIKRAVIMCEGRYITSADLELDAVSNALPLGSLKDARESLERDLVEKALNRHAGKIAAAAAELNVSRPTLYELIDKLGIQRPEARPPGP